MSSRYENEFIHIMTSRNKNIFILRSNGLLFSLCSLAQWKVDCFQS